MTVFWGPVVYLRSPRGRWIETACAGLEPRTGQLSDSRTRFLGARAVRLFRLPLGGREGVLALSARPWAAYNHPLALVTSPLAYQALEHGCSFASEHCPEGIVAIAGNTLRILSLEKLGDAFNAEAAPLRYTPRQPWPRSSPALAPPHQPRPRLTSPGPSSPALGPF